MINEERRLYDAKLGAAIQNACDLLPHGYSIEISLKSIGLAVVLIDNQGCEVYPIEAPSLADAVNEALKIARNEERKSEEVPT